MRNILLAAVSSFCLMSVSSMAIAKDDDIYKTEVENECVHVARATFRPHQKTDFFDAAPALLVFLTDGELKTTFAPDNREEFSGPIHAKTVYWAPKFARLKQENVRDTDVPPVVVPGAFSKSG